MPGTSKKGDDPQEGSKEMPPTATAKASLLGEESSPNIIFVNPPRKHLHELTGNDIPPGVDPDDLTIECEDLD